MRLESVSYVPGKTPILGAHRDAQLGGCKPQNGSQFYGVAPRREMSWRGLVRARFTVAPQ